MKKGTTKSECKRLKSQGMRQSNLARLLVNEIDARLSMSTSLSQNLLVEKLDQLQDLLDDAQNAPPNGMADGSIPEPLWSALLQLCRSVPQVVADVQRVHREFTALTVKEISPA